MEAAWSCWECLERLILTVALQLAAVAYGVNSFSEPLEDLEGCMVKLLECLIKPGYRLGIITGCSRFVVDAWVTLKIFHEQINESKWQIHENLEMLHNDGGWTGCEVERAIDVVDRWR
eukprot:Gb_32650 [translate_table: standard]